MRTKHFMMTLIGLLLLIVLAAPGWAGDKDTRRSTTGQDSDTASSSPTASSAGMRSDNLWWRYHLRKLSMSHSAVRLNRRGGCARCLRRLASLREIQLPPRKTTRGDMPGSEPGLPPKDQAYRIET